MMMGFVRIFLALAAYRRVLIVSDKFERAGDIQAIWKEVLGIRKDMKRAQVEKNFTINVTPLPAKLSANNFVNLLSRYGMCPVFFLLSLNCAMQ